MDREKIHKLLDAILDISELKKGDDGFPFVHFAASNYPPLIEILTKDAGFKKGTPFDGSYEFYVEGETDPGKYDACMEHLEKLKNKAENLLKEKVL